MFLSKGLRWTIYTTIIVGVVVGGLYLTATQTPDQYTPRETVHEMPGDGDNDGAEAEQDLSDDTDSASDAGE